MTTLHTYGKYFPQHLQLPKNTNTMISPARWLPAASILQVSAIAVRRAIDIDHHNTAMQLFFYMKRTVIFYFIDYILCR
jgi:hypothetical protein